MTPYRFGDILLLNAFPFTNKGGIKKRPALVLADTGDWDLLLCRITSEPARDRFDLELMRWQELGLLLPSTIRLSKIATLSKRLVIQRLGYLGSPDRRRVHVQLKKIFGFA